MCEGGWVPADFLAGAFDEADVADEVAECLTTSADGRRAIWAQKGAPVLSGRVL